MALEIKKKKKKKKILNALLGMARSGKNKLREF